MENRYNKNQFMEELVLIRNNAITNIKLILMHILFFLILTINKWYSDLIICSYYILMANFFMNSYYKIHTLIKKYELEKISNLYFLKNIKITKTLNFVV